MTTTMMMMNMKEEGEEKEAEGGMDPAHARLLQQQQIFLQLQILRDQKSRQTPLQRHALPPSVQSHAALQTSFSYQPVNQQAPGRQSSGSPANASSSSSAPGKNSFRTLPRNLEELKVSELRQHLRIRGLPVSGTKTSLIDRLRPFIDSTGVSPHEANANLSVSGFPSSLHPFCSSGSISPASSDLSVGGSLADSFSDGALPSPPFGHHCFKASVEEISNLEKDRLLLEKQKLIEELRWRLQQEQRQVEQLRSQLHGAKHTVPAFFCSAAVKQEPVSNCDARHLPEPEQMSLCHPHCAQEPLCVPPFLTPHCSPEVSPVSKCSISPASPSQIGQMRNSLHLSESREQRSCSFASEEGSIQPLYCSPPDHSRSPRAAARSKLKALHSPQMEELLEELIHSGGSTGSRFPRSGSHLYGNSPLEPLLIKNQSHLDFQQKTMLETGGTGSGPGLGSASEMGSGSGPGLGSEASLGSGSGSLMELGSQSGLGSDFRSGSHSGSEKGIGSGLCSGSESVSGLESGSASGLVVSVRCPESLCLGMSIPEAPWESMEWLDLPPLGFQNPSAAQSGSGFYSPEFLDVSEISLNSAMELPLEHW
ncbi:hypothetical protein DNTS_016180 [Danionella cerebrum]|uniref:SAP domain-containing protein n=1 Tax=Danionella cerebrum TaxID=2873325 RepID=A0A553Q4X4_9TELE|nr:hypothetical protein DNTS_016180 [Danionella translucida]